MTTPTDEIQDLLIGFDEPDVLTSLIAMGIINSETGSLTDYWMVLLDPKMLTKRELNEEEVLEGLARMLKNRL